MKRRALLVGSALGLSATTNDVLAMQSELELYNFECHTLTEAAATRAGILGAFHDLIERAGPEDAAVFYYSGHGGLAPNPRFSPARIGQLPKSFRYLVPIDYPQSTEQDFRAITNHELGWLIEGLRARTENVTVVLDCCHAARITRGAGNPSAKAWRSPPPGIAAHLARLEALGIDTTMDGRRPTRTVCISACAEHDSAYEYTTATGLRISVMTQFLCQGLALARGGEVDWRNLIARVREQVVAEEGMSTQRPLVEGAALRLLFSLDEHDANGILTVALGSPPRLAGGSLLGVQLGDRYVLEAPSLPGQLPERVAFGHITDVDGASAGLALDFVADHVELPAHTLARPIRSSRAALPIYVEPEAHGREQLERELAQFTELSLVTRPEAHEGLVRLSADQRELRAMNTSGITLFTRPRAAALRTSVEALLPFAHAHDLLLLEGNSAAIDREFELVWGTVGADSSLALPARGSTLRSDERYFVRVKNHAQRSLWVSMIEIGVAAERRLLNASYAPEGWELGPDASFVLGERDGRLTGVSSAWPADLDRSKPGCVSLLVIVSSQPHDLRSLEGKGVRSDARAPASANFEFAVAKLSFWLDAAPMPTLDVPEPAQPSEWPPPAKRPR